MRAPCLLAIGLVCLLTAPLFAATAGDSAPNGARVLADIRAFFKDAEVRHPGSRGNLLIERRVAGEFAKSGFRHGEIRFRAPVFQPGRTDVSAKGLPPIRVLPMHPTVFRPGNFLEQDYKTRLVYLGHGTVADLAALKGVPLDGAVGVMEFNCGTTWQRFLRFGIKGFYLALTTIAAQCESTLSTG